MSCSFGPLAAYADVVLDPRISAAISHTDNVTLAAENEQSETVYELTPSIGVQQSSARIETSLNYRLQAYYYSDRSDTESYHALNLGSQVVLQPDRVFLGFGASKYQVIRDPSEPVAFGNLPISGNRTDRHDYYVGPSFAYPFAANATARGSFRRTWVRYDEVSPSLLFAARDFESDSLQLSFDNYRKQQGLTWALRFGEQETDYELFIPWEHRQASIELGAWTAGGLRVFIVGGKESAWDKPFDASLEDRFWEAGFSKQSGDRFSLEVASGERTYGSSSRASIGMTFENGRMSLGYSETPTTSNRDPASSSGLIQEPEDFLDRAGAIERYISERLVWSLSFDMRRTELSLDLFDEDRTQRFRLDGLPLPDEEQSGAGVSVSLQVGVRTHVRASARRATRELLLDDERMSESFGVGVRYELGTRTDVSLDLRRSEEEPRGMSMARGYDANLLTLRVTRTFRRPQ